MSRRRRLLCSKLPDLANILNAVYSFGKLTTGVDCIASAGKLGGKLLRRVNGTLELPPGY